MCYDHKGFASAYAPQILKNKLNAAIARQFLLCREQPIRVEAYRAQERLIAQLREQIYESGYARSPKIPEMLQKQAW